MDIYVAFQVLNNDLIKVARSINVLQEIKEQKKVNPIRLQESSFILSEETYRFSKVVSAHNLHQYKNQFHSISLKEDVKSWLDLLLNIDVGEEFNVT